MDEEKKMVIRHPERIKRIMARIADSHIPIIIRKKSNESTGVKGRIAKTHDKSDSIMIEDISEKGIRYLELSSHIIVEFILTEAKIQCQTKVKRHHNAAIEVFLPEQLVSFERRKNARAVCLPDAQAFISIDGWPIRGEDPWHLPYFPHADHLRSRLQVKDISLNGLCIESCFPAIGYYLKKDIVERRSRLFLPFLPPISAPFEVKWVKLTREDVTIDNEIFQKFYVRIGCSFTAPSNELQKSIQTYISMLSQKEAI